MCKHSDDPDDSKTHLWNELPYCNELPTAFIPDRAGVYRSTKSVSQFNYLGMIFNESSDKVHKEIRRRVALATGRFGAKEAAFYKKRQYNHWRKYFS